MQVVYRRCAGLDVHQKTVHVCVRQGKAKKVQSEVAIFGTCTEELVQLREFLRSRQVKRIVMESTGVYWIPVWNVLERSPRWKFDLVLVNPQHVRALPGRKTDQQDAERLAELGQYDLLRGSFIPPLPQRELRDLTRRRARLQGDRNRVINRISRWLEKANLKLSSVVSNLVGKTGLLILHALARGETSPARLAGLAQGRLKAKQTELARALDGFIDDHFRWGLNELLEDLDRLNSKLHALECRIREQIHPWQSLVNRLCTIPAVQEVTAWTLLAELGMDMQPFADAGHAASWAGLCPGSCESAGKRQSGKTRKGNLYLRRSLIQNAWAVSHMKNCFLTDLFFRIAGRRGMKKAAMAVAHRILIIAYHLIRDGGVYKEAGGNFFDRLQPEKTAKRLAKRLQRIGYAVTLTPMSDPLAMAGNSPLSQPFTLDRPAPNLMRNRSCKCARWGIPCLHEQEAAPPT